MPLIHTKPTAWTSQNDRLFAFWRRVGFGHYPALYAIYHHILILHFYQAKPLQNPSHHFPHRHPPCFALKHKIPDMGTLGFEL